MTDHLDSMFEQVLSEAEVKAIARSRHFPVGAAPSRSVVKNFFLTQQGIVEMLATLSEREVALLHLMHFHNESQDITFFERVYYEDEVDFADLFEESFHQRYRGVLKEVRERLVRKGLLIFWQDWYGRGAKIEQYRFHFPPEFAAKLPPLLQPIRVPDNAPEPIEAQDLQARRKILQLAGEPQTDPLAKDPKSQLTLVNGSLLWGKERFTLPAFTNWQIECWSKLTAIRILGADGSLHPVQAVMQIVQRLGEGEWFDPSHLEETLNVFCFGLDFASAEEVLDEGWEWGLFLRRKREGRWLYRPRVDASGAALPEGEPPVDEMLRVEEGRAWVDLERVSPAVLADLNQLCALAVEKKRLVISVDLAKLTQAFPLLDSSPTALLLRANLPAFDEAVTNLRSRWGKTLLHQNLLVARIKDVGLRMQIERAFTVGEEYVPLNGEWIALRQDALEAVERMVKKANFVVRRVKAGSSGAGGKA